MDKEGWQISAEEEPIKEAEISCAYCGPGTLAAWDVVTEDGVVYVCHKHHADMIEAKVIQLERRVGENTWEEINEMRAMLNEEEFLDNLTEFKDLKDYE